MTKTFETIARYTDTSEALVVKGRLESEGIPAFIVDHGTLDSDPLISTKSGGVKLNVSIENKEQALAIIKSISDFSIDNEGSAIACPNCGGEQVKFYSNQGNVTNPLALFFRRIFSKPTSGDVYDYKCSHCEHKFLLK
ncbi:MAG: DUF2007 domain-containing protein [Flavobacteriaceae bacterium]|nr:DUF2007 domain-containing protein [Flavobacteriaceae bacterium]